MVAKGGGPFKSCNITHLPSFYGIMRLCLSLILVMPINLRYKTTILLRI